MHIQGCNFVTQCFHPYSGNLGTVIFLVLLLIAGMGLEKNVITSFMRACVGLGFLFVSRKFTDNICFSLHILLLKFT